MIDDLRLLAAADPAPASAWPDGPLDDAGERHLQALTARRAPGRSAVPRRRSTRWALLAAAPVGLAAALALVVGSTGTPAPPVAVQPAAAPAPLAVDARTPVPSLAELAATAADRAAGRPPSAVRGSHVRAWYLGFAAEGEGFPAVVLPEEQLSAPRPDGGVTVLRVPADPGRPAEVRLAADGPVPQDAEVSAVSATELATYPEDRTPPPADVDALGEHLAAVAAPAPPDARELLTALERVLMRWTPGPAEHAAITGWLAQQAELAPLGTVTDRLGRPGVAYALDARTSDTAPEVRHTVVLDPATGAVLSMELSFLQDTGDWEVEPYAVMSYVAFVAR